MSTPDFKTLLEGATPGPWDSPQDNPIIYRNEEGQNFSGGDWHIYPPLGESGPISIVGHKANAAYIARCNPATMRLVLEALEAGANQTRMSSCGEIETGLALDCQRALAALNGETP